MSEAIPPKALDFVELMTEFQGRLFGYVMTLTGDPDAANDILQETNVVLWKQSQQFELGTNFKAWAFRIAHFQFMAYRQRRLREKVLYSDDLLATLAAEYKELDEQHDQRADALEQCLALIAPRSRDAIRMRYADGLPLTALAAKLNRTSNAVSQLLFRARCWLLECVRRQNDKEAAR
ncbi:MAG: sigma-70 family RNA polymerase sigma factor [Pirellulales bacterium]|nr:sigma-70 family RNA polymerase sigma factor [Pirellulales bacterium]